MTVTTNRGAAGTSVTGTPATGQGAAAAAPRTLDPYVLRADFPILRREINGHPLVYLDSASTSQKPDVVIDAVANYYRQYNANVHRGIYTIGEEATAAYEAARTRVASFINAPDSHEIVFTRNATEAINLVSYSWGRRNIDRGDTIVLTEMEHHANLVPWQLLVQEKDGDLEFIPITDDGILRLDVFEVLLGLKPKLVAFTHVSNTLGTINPVRQMVDLAHAAGALVLIDGAQAAPHLPVDVQELGCDFYAFSGHKMLGPMGSGALWARRELLEAMPPFLSGGEMIREVHLRRSDFNDIPWKFEAGTPAVGDAIGLGVAADYLGEIGMDAVRAHERKLVAYGLETLVRDVPGIELYGPMDPDLRGGVIPFNLPGIHPHDVAQVLDRSGVAVRAGHHCTMPLHERLDLAATARASFSVYSTTEDIDALVRGLAEVRRVFGD
jgi:cysteine desulfurase/selenocysteine lyase